MTQANKQEVRVRIAPSPTGNLHIGTARTALFNWLFARISGGKFILRIEDTDLQRSEKKYEDNIISGLKWLGLNWDEGPIRQSDRLPLYEKYVQQLLDADLAYYCFCTEEELEEDRKAMLAKGFAPKYSGKCRAQNAKSGGAVIRFKIPEEKITFKDLIRGDISFDGSLIGDIAIAKSGSENSTGTINITDGRVSTSRKDPLTPLYNFAVVIDDYDMKISHVIRGEDHIANTPKQIFIQKALGFPTPIYAHLPLILDQNRAKMSKRHSAVSVDEYKQEGFLPEALINFMTLLGWHPEKDGELLGVNDIIKIFSIERVQKAGAVFDMEKLRWMNSQYIKKSDNNQLLQNIEALYPEVATSLAKFDENTKLKIISLTKERIQTLSEFSKEASFLINIPEYVPELLIWKTIDKETIKNNLQETLKELEKISDSEFHKEKIEMTIKNLSERLGRGEVFWPLRVAMSGLKSSPAPVEIIDALGKKESLTRITAAIQKIK